MQKNKEFNQDLHGKYDKAAKKKLIDHLKKRGVDAWENPDRYGPDIVSRNNGQIFFHEVEIKTVWKGRWPLSWDTVQIPCRKQKFLKYHRIFFWVISFNMDYAWSIWGGRLKKAGQGKITCNQVDGQDACLVEDFLCVQVDQCHLIKF